MSYPTYTTALLHTTPSTASPAVTANAMNSKHLHTSHATSTAPPLFQTSTNTSAPPEKLLVTLRDGRKLIGTLRSWDQYGNLVLQDTLERRFLTIPPESKSSPAEEEPQHLYSDEDRGIYIVRGENIVLMGEIVRLLRPTPAHIPELRSLP